MWTILIVMIIALGILLYIVLSGGEEIEPSWEACKDILCPPEYYCDAGECLPSEDWLPDIVLIPPESCDYDAHNCGDFELQVQAQAVYDICVDQGAGDVHRLDSDGDGEVCESLP